MQGRKATDDYTVAKYLPKRTFTIFGKSFSLNPGPWNAKEHALIVVAYWGSCYAAYGEFPHALLGSYSQEEGQARITYLQLSGLLPTCILTPKLLPPILIFLKN